MPGGVIPRIGSDGDPCPGCATNPGQPRQTRKAAELFDQVRFLKDEVDWMAMAMTRIPSGTKPEVGRSYFESQLRWSIDLKTGS